MARPIDPGDEVTVITRLEQVALIVDGIARVPRVGDVLAKWRYRTAQNPRDSAPAGAPCLMLTRAGLRYRRRRSE